MTRRADLPSVAWLCWAALAVSSLCCSSKPPYEGKSVEQLQQMLRSDDVATQVQACYGLGRLGPRGAPAVPLLTPRLHSREVLVRENAALALGKIGPAAREAVGGLTELLRDPDWRIRRQAAMALGEIGPDAEPALPALKKLLKDQPTVRRAAEEAIARIAPAQR